MKNKRGKKQTMVGYAIDQLNIAQGHVETAADDLKRADRIDALDSIGAARLAITAAYDEIMATYKRTP